MPRFLNTWTGEFECHDPERVAYAILSHTWRSPEDGGEQIHCDVVKLQAAAKQVRGGHPPYNNPLQMLEFDDFGTIFALPELSEKIKGACKVARDAGYRLIWIDSCCIDKTSSAELAEAINSMFKWYRLSSMCYAYLEDVSCRCEASKDQAQSRFWNSRWHTRSWTLQELIAPRHVEFLARGWCYLGTKKGLALILKEITGIDIDILTGEAEVGSVSVARRLLWAEKREATRIEDEAYSLTGIFGIYMAPIYGEGRNAFKRLQDEIARTDPQQSFLILGTNLLLKSLTKKINPRADDAQDYSSSKSSRRALDFDEYETRRPSRSYR